MRRILLADDSKPLRDAVKRLLTSLPEWQVCGEAINGREAVEQAFALKPDVILMDVGMPELDGLEATRKIRENDTDIEVLIFSQYDSREARQLAAQAGARGYLTKARSAELVEALETIAHHRNYTDPVPEGF